MKALFCHKDGSIDIDETDIPKAGPDQVLIKMQAGAICGTDIHIRSHGFPGIKYPEILGHEISGIIEKTGKNCKTFSVGDKVSVFPFIHCGECYLCKRGNIHVCQKIKSFGMNTSGGFAEYFTTYERCLAPIPNGVSFPEAAMAEPVGCCLHGLELINIKINDGILITGDGPAGLIFTQLCKMSGAGKVMIIGHHDSRLAIAKEYGADSILNSHKVDWKKETTSYFDGKGPDIVIETTGAPSLLNDVVDVIAPKGVLLYYSVILGDVTVNVGNLQLKEILFVNITRCPHTMQTALKLIADKKIDVKKLISKKIPLSRAKEAFVLAEDKKKRDEIIKVILIPD